MEDEGEGEGEEEKTAPKMIPNKGKISGIMVDDSSRTATPRP